jgi:hypothetical protein
MDNGKAAAIVITVLVCVLSNLKLVTETRRFFHPNDSVRDGGAQADQRFSELRRTLPERGVVGYLGEPTETGLKDYYLAQYALVPLVIEHSQKSQLVIANFPASVQDSRPLEPPDDFVTLKNFGNGVLLLAKRDAK